MSQLVMTEHGLSCLEHLLLLITGMSDPQAQVKSRVAWLLSYLLNVHTKLSWAFEHRSTPLANIQVTSWIKKTDDCPSQTFQTVRHCRVKFSHFNNQVDRCINVFILMLGKEINPGLVRIRSVRCDVVHLDEAWLWLSEDLAGSLQAEAQLTVFNVQRRVKNGVEMDLDTIRVLGG